MLKQSFDQQAERSEDSATGTSFSDQRSESDDQCPCETCFLKKNDIKATASCRSHEYRTCFHGL